MKTKARRSSLSIEFQSSPRPGIPCV